MSLLPVRGQYTGFVQPNIVFPTPTPGKEWTSDMVQMQRNLNVWVLSVHNTIQYLTQELDKISYAAKELSDKIDTVGRRLAP